MHSMQPVTLYISVTMLVNMASLSLPKSHPNIPTEDIDFPVGMATTSGHVQFPTAEPLSPPLHCLPIKTSTPVPQNWQEVAS